MVATATVPGLSDVQSPATADEAWLLVAAIASVLIVASLLGQLLRIRVARRAPHAAIDNLNSRINAWWAITFLLGLALYGGRTGVCLLFGFASLAALHEFVSAGAPQACSRPLWIGSGCLLVVALQYLCVWSASYLAFATLLPLLACLPLLAVPSARGRVWLASTRRLCAGLLICVFSVSHLPALLTLLPDGAAVGWRRLVFLLLVVQASDVLQYLWGKLAGRHLITPRLSPSKTVEGTVGGILSACALGAMLSSLTPFTRLQAILISLLLTLLGFAGGLLLSAVKRRRGIKDWGSVIPGHGGVLDRLDSLFLPAPAFYYLLRYGWTTE